MEQLHTGEADAGQAEASLNALLDDEACKLRILDYLRKVARRQVGRMPAVSIGWRAAIGAKRDHNATLSALAASCEGSESIITYLLAAMTSTSTRTSGLIN